MTKVTAADEGHGFALVGVLGTGWSDSPLSDKDEAIGKGNHPERLIWLVWSMVGVGQAARSGGLPKPNRG